MALSTSPEASTKEEAVLETRNTPPAGDVQVARKKTRDEILLGEDFVDGPFA